MPAAQLLQGERELLVEAKSLMGRLPFDELDLLIVDWTGKNISGTGMDTNVIGRMMQNFEPEPAKTRNPAYIRPGPSLKRATATPPVSDSPISQRLALSTRLTGTRPI